MSACARSLRRYARRRCLSSKLFILHAFQLGVGLLKFRCFEGPASVGGARRLHSGLLACTAVAPARAFRVRCPFACASVARRCMRVRAFMFPMHGGRSAVRARSCVYVPHARLSLGGACAFVRLCSPCTPVARRRVCMRARSCVFCSSCTSVARRCIRVGACAFVRLCSRPSLGGACACLRVRVYVRRSAKRTCMLQALRVHARPSLGALDRRAAHCVHCEEDLF